MLSIIVAIANDNVIGKDNQLIWHIPEDLKRFKEITTGKTIIMGKRTFESLGRVLPNRKHVVLAYPGELEVNHEDVEVVESLDALKEYIDSAEECFVIGGGIIYKTLMEHSNKLYITKINHDFEGDTYFPEIDDNEWKVEENAKGVKDEQNPYDYEYITYIRKN